MRKRIEFETIDWGNSGLIGLAIYPPGTLFDNSTFIVSIGGCRCGDRKTLASAKKLLLERAIARCDELIVRAKATIEDFERGRQELVYRGLKRKTKGKSR